jgi:hypothetical protein
MPMGMAIVGLLVAVVAVFIMPGILDFIQPFRGETASMQQILLDGITRIGAGSLAGLLLALVTQRFLPLRRLGHPTTSIENGNFVSAIQRSEVQVESVVASDGLQVNKADRDGDQSEEWVDRTISQDKVITLPIMESVLEAGNRFGASYSWTLGLVITGISLGVFGVFTVVSIVAVLIGLAVFMRPRCCPQQCLDPSLWLWLACLIYFVIVGAMSRSVYWKTTSQSLSSPQSVGVGLAVIAIGFVALHLLRCDEIQPNFRFHFSY